MKVHWQPAEAVSWPSGGKRNPQMRTFLLPGNIVCHADGFGTSNRAHVTCGNCLSRMRVARIDTKEMIETVLARGQEPV
jgi:hypothetical protein